MQLTVTNFTASTTFALMAVRGVIQRTYGIEPTTISIQQEMNAGPQNTSIYTFVLTIAAKSVTVKVRTWIGPDGWLMATINVHDPDDERMGLTFRGEQHNGIAIVWTDSEELRRREHAAGCKAGFLSKWPAGTHETYLIELGYPASVAGFMTYLEHHSGVRYQPVSVEGEWRLHPTTPDGWIKSAPVTKLPPPIVALLETSQLTA